MGVGTLLILNRVGLITNWNIHFFNRLYYLYIFYYFYLIKKFFKLFFIDFFFSFKILYNKSLFSNNGLHLFRYNIFSGDIYLFKIHKWLILFLNIFILDNSASYYSFKRYVKFSKIFFFWKYNQHLKYKNII